MKKETYQEREIIIRFALDSVDIKIHEDLNNGQISYAIHCLQKRLFEKMKYIKPGKARRKKK